MFFNDELFQQEKERYEVDDFELILSDNNFHFNIFIVLSYVYLNYGYDQNITALNPQTPIPGGKPAKYQLKPDKTILVFMENVKALPEFNLFSSFKISNSLK